MAKGRFNSDVHSVFSKVEVLICRHNSSDGWLVADPWLMVVYHGDWGWSFPEHPHSGFETVTCVMPGSTGFVDHADSLGNIGRYGAGDVQWMTAGNGLSHSEVAVHHVDDPKADRSLRHSGGQLRSTGWMFQLWLNLPASSKLKPPAEVMFWSEQLPVEILDEDGKRAFVRSLAGPGLPPDLKPPPNSWAADPKNAVQILHVWLEDGAQWNLTRASPASNCVLYLFGGDMKSLIAVAPEERQILRRGYAGKLANSGETMVSFIARGGNVEILVLEGMPIGEPVCWKGPMVTESDRAMNAAIARYNRGQMGQWDYTNVAPVHIGKKRFTCYGEMSEPPDLGETEEWPADPTLRA
jgi:redox-sensitive bicupin YhaK (pirin superfamily)